MLTTRPPQSTAPARPPMARRRGRFPGFVLYEFSMMREGGLEPPRLAAPDPKADAPDSPVFRQVMPCRKQGGFFAFDATADDVMLAGSGH
jgi:hypothetical protein